MDEINLDNYKEFELTSNKVKEVLQQIAYMDCFIEANPPNKPKTAPYTTLVINKDSLLTFSGRRVTSIDVPGGYVRRDGYMVLNWCVPGYLGDAKGPVFIYTTCKGLYGNGDEITLCTIVQGDLANDMSELKAYKLKGPEKEKPMNVPQEIVDLKKEIQELRNLLAGKNEKQPVTSSNTKVDVQAVTPVDTKNIVIPGALRDYYTPSLATKLVMNGYENLKYIHYQSPGICEIAVKQSPFALSYIHDQTPSLCEVAINSDPRALQFVEKQSIKLCKLAIDKDPRALSYVRVPTHELIEYAFSLSREYPESIVSASLTLAYEHDIKTYEMFKDLVKRMPYFLSYVPEILRTDEMIKIALDGSYKTISLLEDQTPYTEYVVGKTWEALPYIRNVTPELYMYALKKFSAPITVVNRTGYDQLPAEWIKCIDLLNVPKHHAELLAERCKSLLK